MPIFDQGYQHWEGKTSGHAWRWLAITRQGVRAHIRGRWTKYLILSSWSLALFLAAALALWGLFEQKSDLIKPVLEGLAQLLPPEIVEGPRAFRASIWTVCFHVFFLLELCAAMVLVMMVGPDLISQDLRYNALPLYFSKPLRRADYFLGKLGVIATFLALVMVLPALAAWLVGVGFSLDPSVIGDTWRIPLASVGYGLFVSVTGGLVMLAFSSLSKNSRYVALMWLGLWLAGAVLSESLTETLTPGEAREPWRSVSIFADYWRVQEAMLGTEAARDQIGRAVHASFLAAQDQMQSQAGGLAGGLLNLLKPKPPEPPPYDPAVDTPSFLDWLVNPYDWGPSAAALGGLSLLAIVVLSTRVRSLDNPR